MSNFIIGCALGALLAAAIAAPFVAPWSIRVRLLASASATDPWLGLAPATPLDIRTVTLIEVEARRGRVELVAEELGGARVPCRIKLAREACSPAVIARLDGWSVLHTPLLLIADAERRAQLYGPHFGVTDLDFAQSPVR